MRVSNVTMVECSDYGSTFSHAGENRINNSILIENSHYIQYARPDCVGCYNNPAECSNSNALVIPTLTMGG